MEIGGNDIDDEQRVWRGCEVLKHAAVKIKNDDDDDDQMQVKGRDRLPTLTAPVFRTGLRKRGAQLLLLFWSERRESYALKYYEY